MRSHPIPVFLLLLLAAMTPFVSGCGGGGTSLEGWNLLVITLDTTRFDRLGCYGYENARTPRLDALAESGVRFDKAMAQTPLTLPSHASIFTGTYPTFHGARTNGFYSVPDERETLAEILRGAGYQTAATIAAVVLGRRYGIAQGFDRFDDDPRDMVRESNVNDPSRRAPSVTRASLAMADSFDRDRPYFLWAHYFDPHAPYDPPAEIASQFPDTKSGRYDAEIAATDLEVGRLLDGLEERGLLKRTLIVVLADHGEGFAGPHEESTHGLLVYDDTMRVPFFISARGHIPSGRVDSNIARQVDVLPTVLDLLQIDHPQNEVQGTSLVERIRGNYADAPTLYSYGETLAPWDSYGWSPLFHTRSDRWKYIEAPVPELYDLEADPDESVNVVDQHPDKAKELRTWLLEVQEQTSGASAFSPGLVRDDKDAKRLQALGYASSGQAAPDIAEIADLPNPKDQLHIVDRFNEIGALQLTNWKAAVRAYEDILANDRNNYDAAYRLATLLITKRDFENAERWIEHLLEIRPAIPHNQYLLGNALSMHSEHLRKMNRRADADRKEREALAAYVRAAESELLGAPPLLEAGRLLIRQQKYTEAEEALLDALEYEPLSFDGNRRLGMIYQHQKQFDEARRYFEAAIEAAGDDAAKQRPVRMNLVDVYRALGEGELAGQQARWFVEHFPNDPAVKQAQQIIQEIRSGGN